MFNFLFRIIGMFVLALALVLAVLDMTRSITAGSLIMTPLAQSWQGISPQSYAASEQAVTTLVHPVLWSPVITSLLALPSWLIFWLLAMMLMWIGQPRENRFGRFASR